LKSLYTHIRCQVDCFLNRQLRLICMPSSDVFTIRADSKVKNEFEQIAGSIGSTRSRLAAEIIREVVHGQLDIGAVLERLRVRDSSA